MDCQDGWHVLVWHQTCLVDSAQQAFLQTVSNLRYDSELVHYFTLKQISPKLLDRKNTSELWVSETNSVWTCFAMFCLASLASAWSEVISFIWWLCWDGTLCTGHMNHKNHINLMIWWDPKMDFGTWEFIEQL